MENHLIIFVTACLVWFVAAAMAQNAPPATRPAIDSLWNYSNPSESERRFLDLAGKVLEQGDRSYYLEVLTQAARAMGLQGKFDECHALLDAVERELLPEMQRVRVRLLLERGRALNSAGKPAKALAAFVEAEKVAEGAGELRLRIDAIHMEAIAEERPQERLAHNLRALKLVEESPAERGWLQPLLNNTGECYLAMKDYPRALDCFQKLLEAQKSKGRRPDIYTSKDVAKCLRLCGRAADGLAVIEPVAKALGTKPDGYIEAELAECLTALGRQAEARPHFAEAWRLLREDRGMADNEPASLKRYAELGGIPK